MPVNGETHKYIGTYKGMAHKMVLAGILVVTEIDSGFKRP
jgi:hypothetical protein